ncbi:hypothetical protein PM082_009621 [Marasmius tenuissimus]|nr:hypothetical protein PM082_009621 [Marasmius tenuissimus]
MPEVGEVAVLELPSSDGVRGEEDNAGGEEDTVGGGDGDSGAAGSSDTIVLASNPFVHGGNRSSGYAVQAWISSLLPSALVCVRLSRDFASELPSLEPNLRRSRGALVLYTSSAALRYGLEESTAEREHGAIRLEWEREGKQKVASIVERAWR